MITAKRTEKFEPPMWKNIKEDYIFSFYVKNISHVFYVNKHLKCIDCVLDNHYLLFSYKGKECTEKNYIEACEKVKNLFNKGGKKWNTNYQSVC